MRKVKSKEMQWKEVEERQAGQEKDFFFP